MSARYATITATTMADIIVWIKHFLTSGGWTLSNEEHNATYNRTMWVASKNNISHKLCGVAKGKFPYAVVKADYNWGWLTYWEKDSWNKADSDNPESEIHLYGVYEQAFGLKNMRYDTTGDYFLIAGSILFPCRVFIFETSDQSLLISFESSQGEWEHIYSGHFNKSLTGEWEGDFIMSGSQLPTQFAGIGDGFMHRNGSENGKMSNPATTILSYEGKLQYNRSGSGKGFTAGWPTGSLEKNDYARIYSMFETDAGKLINSIGQNALLGLPTLYPFIYNIDDLRGAYLTDLWICPMVSRVAGELFFMGTHKYFAFPYHIFNPKQLGFAIQVE